MTPLEKKVINHCVEQLQKVWTTGVYNEVDKALQAAGCTDAQSKDVLRVLSNSLNKHMYDHVVDVKSWLFEINK